MTVSECINLYGPFVDRRYRVRRTPGEGVVSLVREAVANIPLVEMKEAYKYKVESNPQFKVSWHLKTTTRGRT